MIERIVAGDGLDDQAAVSLQVVAHHCHGLAVTTGDVERVAAQATVDLHRHALRRALDKEAVVAFEGIDDKFLQPLEGDEEPGAIDALVGHDEVVAKLGSDHGQ